MSRTFCIDIGGTRIKSAILKDDITLDELKLVQPKVTRTLGWLNESLPDIVPFLDDGSTYDRVSISIPDDVLSNGREIVGYLPGAYKVPRDLAEKCEDITGCPDLSEKNFEEFAKEILLHNPAALPVEREDLFE